MAARFRRYPRFYPRHPRSLPLLVADCSGHTGRMAKTLTPKREAFAVAMSDPTCKGPSEAYARAGYDVSKMGAPAINVEAQRLVTDPTVALRIRELRNAIAEPVRIEATAILREWLTIGMADPGELTKTRVGCCRHCYGIEHRYQWRTPDEYGRAIAAVIDYNAGKPAKAHDKRFPDDLGGYGYRKWQEPAEDCPECDGEGVTSTWVADTDRLSPAARRLFAGVKQTRDGIEVKMRDQDGALMALAKHLGMFTDKHEHSGPGGAPIATVVTVDMTPAEAGQVYSAIMKAGS